MTTPARPAVHAIVGLSSGDAPKKTWKHFYAAQEAWERVVAADVAALRAEGEEAVGLNRGCCTELPDDTLVRRPAFGQVAALHHREHYGPAYLAALENPATRWARHASEARKLQVLAPNAILVSVAIANPHFVITAFRPVPRMRGVIPGEEELALYAEDYYMRKTTAGASTHASALFDWLESHGGDAPTNRGELWRLAVAVGRARARSRGAVSQTALLAAERVLAVVPAALRDQMVGSLDWEGAFEALRAGIAADDHDEFEDALLSTEDLLAAAWALGVNDAIRELLEDTEVLCEVLPSEWDALERFANRRLDDASVTRDPPNRLWATVRVAAQRRWRAELVRLCERLPAPSAFSRSICLDRYLRQGGPPERWIEGPGSAPAGGLRAFVVALDGHVEDVTDLVVAGAVCLWALDAPGDGATVFVFESDAPIPGETLQEVLAEAQNRSDIVVSRREFSRPR
jgi:hypothetical protein